MVRPIRLLLGTTTVILLWFTENLVIDSIHSFRNSFSNSFDLLGEIQPSALLLQQKNWDFYPQVESAKYGGCFKNVKNHTSAPNWQVWREVGLTWYLFGAYWDNRITDELSDKSEYAVRILIRRRRGKISKHRKLQCYIWYKEAGKNELQLEIKAPVSKKLLPYKAPNYPAYLISCPVSAAKFPKDKPPVGVSLVFHGTRSGKKSQKSGNSTLSSCTEMENFLPIVYNPLSKDVEEKLDFAICHKALCFDEKDPSKLFIEWMEMHRILGVQQVFLYEYFSLNGTNISKTLDYYKKQGFLQKGQISLPEPQLKSQSKEDIVHYLRDQYNDYKQDKWTMELVTYHDCFYRNMYRFRYIALLDLDEIIMPIEDLSWGSFIRNHDHVKVKNVKSFSFENNIFPNPEFRDSNVPNDSYVLQNINRIQSKSYVINRKLIYSTATSLGVHHHHSGFCLGFKSCWVSQVNSSVARLHHYCLDGVKSCPNKDKVKPLVDRTTWKFKDDFVPAIENVHRKLGFD